MISGQDVYNITEWLVYNKDFLLASIEGLENDFDIQDRVMYLVAENYRAYCAEDIIEAFEDEKLLTAFEFYFKKRDDNESTH